jgi:hypothetical protein
MVYFSPIVKSLNSVTRVNLLIGKDPFPAQVVVLYCAWGKIVFGVWNLYWGIFKEILREEIIGKMQELLSDKKEKYTRTKLVLTGLLAAIMMVFLLGYVLFWTYFPDTTIDWREISFYSSGIGSVTFILICSVTLATTFYLCIGMVLAGIRGPSQELIMKETQ